MNPQANGSQLPLLRVYVSSVVASLLCLLPAGALAAPLPDSPREQISLNQGWRFTHGDPANVDPKSLLYDVRPVSHREDRQPRLAESTADASPVEAATHRVLRAFSIKL